MSSGSDGLSTIFGAELRKIRARERFVLDGQRPSGLVSESIIQSWERCLSRGRSTHECVVPTLLPKHAMKHSLRRSQKIVDAADPALRKLDAALTHTGCVMSLLDPAGVVIHAGSEHPASGELVRQWCRVGVDLSEEAMGTSAPAIVMQSGGAAQVDCAEHYFAGHASIRCAAAPVLDWHGGLAGILNIAVESRAFGFDAKEIVMTYAASIENRLLRMQPAGYRLIEFHLATDMIGPGSAGLAGVRQDGRVVWINGVGARLLGVSRAPNCDVETIFGIAFDVLRMSDETVLHRLPNGLTVCMSISGSPAHGPAQMHIAVSRDDRLADQHNRLILETLAANDGNIARAARRLGVSRGTIYRAMGTSGSR
ncbi:sigma-54 activated regulatory protein [Caballeronia cordobensis]|uniref:Sigma-54 activated regulatory protein n=1 Tax=Caballeronia cordobensis TaxID=1353886 RepID=A0A158IWC3_CABCO|nr:helix-turn-helix domain-containing protein [Caballeronia cordobensis]SAL60410.1 sigma-54 activated regulatory protein [Caballeronia cordobensis]